MLKTSIKQQLKVLNEMLTYYNDSESDGDGIIYIDVDLAPNLEALKAMLPLTYKDYIKDFGNDVNEHYTEGTIDLSPLVWGELKWGKKDIWFSPKSQKFFVAHVNTYAAHKIKEIKRSICRKANSLKFKYKNFVYRTNRKREQKEALRRYGLLK